MALPIKETPVLTGKDARRFEEKMKNTNNKVIPEAEYIRIMEVGKRIYPKFLKIEGSLLDA